MVGEIDSFVGNIEPHPQFHFLTIDADIYDELINVYWKLREFKETLEGMRTTIKDFYDKLQEASKDRPKDGRGELSYDWYDSQGQHWVRVNVGPFKFPQYVKRSKRLASHLWLDKETCTYIEPIDDIHGSRTWVRVIRGDPAGNTKTPWLSLKSGKATLGRWNPILDSAKDESIIPRRTRAYYSWDRVGIAAKDKGDK